MSLTPKEWDARRDLIIPGNKQETLLYCARQFIQLADEAIRDHGAFFVALSGGSTPKALFELLTTTYKDSVPWDKCHIFWSDERAVPPQNPDSNYHMAMQAGLSHMPIPTSQIHRMPAEFNIEESAANYEKTIEAALKNRPFDLIMLGMGEDGHTASLFPDTKGLTINDRLVIANHVPQKNCWRMSFTFKCINEARHISIYVLGASKQEITKDALTHPDKPHPINTVGTPTNHALWILDEDAAQILMGSS